MHSRSRKYDIGHGVTIEDNGYWLTAHHVKDDKSSSSTGIRRPHIGPLPLELDAVFSQDMRYFYLHDFTSPHGFWLGTKAWANEEEMKAQQPAGIMGKAFAGFTPTATGITYYREVMHFNVWSIKDKKDDRGRSMLVKVSNTDDMVLDYLSLAQNEDREQEKRFNAVIAPSGRDLKWVIDRIGEWVPLPPEPPPTVLT
jgi:hypothetical protein